MHPALIFFHPATITSNFFLKYQAKEP